MTRVMLVPNVLYEDSVDDARMLEGWLDELGVDVVRPPVFGFDGDACLEGVDLVVSLGGDGTLLRAGWWAIERFRFWASPTGTWAF